MHESSARKRFKKPGTHGWGHHPGTHGGGARRVPPSKLKRLERRIADRKGTGEESRKNKSSGGTREIDSLEEHSGYARSDMNVGDQDQGPKSRGGGAKGKAEGGEGRGSRVPRRGFSK